ncbi:MAG: right-handed parallel beta-helix repeat-containing protein [bacterium]
MKKRIVIILMGLFLPVILLAQTTHFTFTSHTGDSYSIVIDDATLNESALSIGDEIGVFIPADLCVGASVWDGSTPLALSAWADDSQTPEIDGYQNGEAMTFKIWEQSSDQEFTATASYTIGDGNFGTGAYAQLTLSAGSETPVLPGGAIIVNNTNDTGPGSLRDAITQANNNLGPDSIKFNIPKGQPGSGYNSNTGVWTISPTSTLPTISDEGLVIDGTSQAEYIGEQTNPFGPEIMLDGSNAGTNTTGLYICASGVEIISLVIANFGGNGVSVSQVEGGRISGCYIGVTADGSELSPNGSNGISVNNCRGLQISPLDTIPNIISGNILHGIYMSGGSSHNIIIGNIIGLNSSKNDTLGNDQYGLFMFNNSDSNEVVDNFIGGNRYGIYLEGSGNVLINNYIGCNYDESDDHLGNGSSGISIYAADNHLEENTIAYNSVYGVQIYGSEALRNNISRNRIFNNGWGGISNENGGNGELSPPDITSVTANSVSGTGPANSTIEIFADEDYQGTIYLGDTMSDASGNFNFNGELPDELNITATATDSEGNTSEFSSPMQTQTQDQHTEQLPQEFKLFQNSPNPFNPVTAIRFSLPLDTFVEMEVYNLSGQKVVTLVNKEMKKGVHEIKYKPENLPSGIYVYCIKTDRFVQAKKMMLLK